MIEPVSYVQDRIVAVQCDARGKVKRCSGCSAISSAYAAASGERGNLTRCHNDFTDPVIAVVTHVQAQSIIGERNTARLLEACQCASRIDGSGDRSTTGKRRNDARSSEADL